MGSHKQIIRLLLGALALLIATIPGCGSTVETAGDPSAATVPAAISIASSQPFTATVTLSTPNGMSVLSPVLEASNAIQLYSTSNVVSGVSVAMGSGGVHARSGAQLNETWSRGKAELDFGARVRGTLHAANTDIHFGAAVAAHDRTPIFDPPNRLTWSVTFPTSNTSDVVVQPSTAEGLAPGAYGSVTLSTGSTLTLHSGTYYFSRLVSMPLSTIRLEQSNGPITIYVKDLLAMSGAFDVIGEGDADLLVVYLGTIPVTIGGPLMPAFKGAIVTPSAPLTLVPSLGVHTGFFAGKDVILGAGTKVQHAPPRTIASVANGGDPEACVRMLAPPANLTGKDLEVAWQTEIARYCTAPTTPSCVTSLIGRANFDYAAAARRTLSHVFSPAQYLALSRDRSRKLHAAESDPSLANGLCADADSDGDWVPDAKDQCPTTSDLTATDDHGCPVSLPPAPSAADVQTVLDSMGMVFNPRCASAPPPPEVSVAALSQLLTPANGIFISAFRVTNQPPGCAVWYQFEIRELLQGVPVKAPYSVVFMDTESLGPVAGIPGLPELAPNLVQFNARPTDAGTRGVLGRTTVTPNRANFRVRAMNANGALGPWSEWKLTSQQDCHALGVTCAIRN